MEVDVPNKTIYVSDDDLPLFARAQELSGDNLSSAVVHALRRFIEIEEARKVGLDEITVLVGTTGAHQRKRFMGARLVRWLQKCAKGSGTEILSVYRTAGKRFVLHTRTLSDWKYAWGDPDYEGNPKNWGIWGSKLWSGGWDWETFKESGDYAFQVFESLEELKAHVSEALYQAVTQAMDAPPLEDLDI